MHITAEGTKQAKALAKKLKDVPFDHIFVSEMRRTQQTAEIVNQFHNATVVVEPLFNDHRSGFEGKPAKLLIEALDSSENRWTAHF